MKIFVYCKTMAVLMVLSTVLYSHPNTASAQVSKKNKLSAKTFQDSVVKNIIANRSLGKAAHKTVVTDCYVSTLSPTTALNYVVTRTFKFPGVNQFNYNDLRSNCEESAEVLYFDGLGRKIQHVKVQASPTANDIITPVSYNILGVEETRFLPYGALTASGAYRYDALQTGTGLIAFYNAPPAGVAQNNYPFSKTLFEPSPLNRVIEQGFEGTDWQPGSGHTRRFMYTMDNDYNDPSYGSYLRSYKAKEVVGIGNEHVRALISYVGQAGNHSLTIEYDENYIYDGEGAGTFEVYKDNLGNVICKKRIVKKPNAQVEYLATYYVYDDMGHLSFVLPPNSGAESFGFSVTQEILDDKCYQYRYDSKGRLIEKKIPGKGWELTVYDKIGNVVMTQDSLQRTKSPQQWIVNKYDEMGRLVITGIHEALGSTLGVNYRTAMQSQVDNNLRSWESRTTAGNGYTSVNFPAVNSELKLNYYDDYEIPGLPSIYNEVANFSKMLTGYLTASKVNVLGTSDQLWNVNYYDDEGRIVKTYSQHYLNANVSVQNYDVVTKSYTFSNQIEFMQRKHMVAGVENLFVANIYEYDNAGRRTNTYQHTSKEQPQFYSPVLISENHYNEIGQLTTKGLHEGMHTTSYSYNERGWLKSKKSDQFSMELKYQTGTVPQYNGNISGQSWGAGLLLDQELDYRYDNADRLIQSTRTGVLMNEIVSYDSVGNITKMNRDGVSGDYHYTGNQLKNVTGGLATNDYFYDGNGNATVDGRTGASIYYNLLNLPSTVVAGATNLNYIFDATGRKLRKVNSGSIGAIDYIDGIHYIDGELHFVQTEEGTASNNAGTYSYEYNLIDHLGNVRYSFYQNPNTSALEMLQSSDYYAFGKRFGSGGSNKYLYNGKELQEELGQYDYGARFYDPVIGRWNVPDPHAISYKSLSPYNYVAGNPINSIDPDGKDLIVLSASKQVGGLGHAAVLIGNKGSGYDLYSKNGTTGLSGAYGPSDQNPVIGRHFDTMEEFLASKDNLTEKGENLYTSGFEIKTDELTDSKMRIAAGKAVQSDYDVLSNSCIDVASEALVAGALSPGFVSKRGNGLLPDQRFGYGGVVSIIPIRRYHDIVNGNRDGSIIFTFVNAIKAYRRPEVSIGEISAPIVLKEKND
ncbi:MAG: RHS repeat-associated core domain-containing protein [Flavobacterium sp.]|nr:MAG: RHS repeat-associated core domain-containing protein [Flavobacterium sp.]